MTQLQQTQEELSQLAADPASKAQGPPTEASVAKYSASIGLHARVLPGKLVRMLTAALPPNAILAGTRSWYELFELSVEEVHRETAAPVTVVNLFGLETELEEGARLLAAAASQMATKSSRIAVYTHKRRLPLTLSLEVQPWLHSTKAVPLLIWTFDATDDEAPQGSAHVPCTPSACGATPMAAAVPVPVTGCAAARIATEMPMLSAACGAPPMAMAARAAAAAVRRASGLSEGSLSVGSGGSSSDETTSPRPAGLDRARVEQMLASSRLLADAGVRSFGCSPAHSGWEWSAPTTLVSSQVAAGSLCAPSVGRDTGLDRPSPLPSLADLDADESAGRRPSPASQDNDSFRASSPMGLQFGSPQGLRLGGARPDSPSSPNDLSNFLIDAFLADFNNVPDPPNLPQTTQKADDGAKPASDAPKR